MNEEKESSSKSNPRANDDYETPFNPARLLPFTRDLVAPDESIERLPKAYQGTDRAIFGADVA